MEIFFSLSTNLTCLLELTDRQECLSYLCTSFTAFCSLLFSHPTASLSYDAFAMASTSPDFANALAPSRCNRATADLDPLRFRRRDSGGPSPGAGTQETTSQFPHRHFDDHVNRAKPCREIFKYDVERFFTFLRLGWTVRRTLKALRPEAVLIMETELWPGFWRVRAPTDSGCRFERRLSERSFRRYRLFEVLCREYCAALVWPSCRLN